jgi:hypothetical protein
MDKASSQIQTTSPVAPAPVEGILQRQCACGNHTIAGGECAECEKDRKKFQLSDKAISGPTSLSPGSPMMRKLAIGKSDDPLEIEADQIADRVLSAPAGLVVAAATPRIQRYPISQTLATGIAPESVSSVLAAPGRPIDAPLQFDMEQRFHHDFSRVRVHSGPLAEQSARDVNARAYTVGNNIVFAAGQFAPGTHEGRRLLAHELTHVVQQSGSDSSELSVQRKTTVGELPLPAEVDFAALADQVYDAIYRIGTDEEAVYRALEQLRQDPSMIATLITTYANRHKGADMIADIHDDFEDEELEYALQLLGRGKAGAAQRVASGPGATDLETAAKRIRAAVEGAGTDEEAIYAALLPFNRATQQLEQMYHFLFGESLRWRINDEMSSDELRHALSLLSFDNETFLEEYFEKSQREFARKILADLLAVKGNRLDFADDSELAVEISKRMRTSQLMQESQTFDAFGYPESCTQLDCPGECIGKGRVGDPDFVPPNINYNAHVNKDARDLWTRGVDLQGYYSFMLSNDGFDNPYKALVKLFTRQDSICDKTLIHCDYLTTVIHHRAFAESIGPDIYNQRVKSGEIRMNLTYWGFVDLMPPSPGIMRSPTAISLQEIQPASEDDLVIGDHVIFWNHLAYDALTASPSWAGPWRLENALLVDQDANGNNLYEGHGAPTNAQQQVVKGDKNAILKDIIDAYNGTADAAIKLKDKVEQGDAKARTDLQQQFPRVIREDTGQWVIKELDVRENAQRTKRSYELRLLSGPSDPELIGLRDPRDPSKMGTVKRPIESAPRRSPSRPK